MATLFVDNLTVIDFSYLHPQRGVVGESWIVDVELDGELNEEGMVFDFGHVKKQIKAWIDQSVDHCLLVPEANPAITVMSGNDQHDIQLFDQPDHLLARITCPAEAVELLDCEKISINAVTELLESSIKAKLPSNVCDVRLTLRVEAISGAYYHYSHGLKKHKGDCQRIAHGHRSAIHVLVDGQRDEELEAYWANKWQDIYLVTDEDIISVKDGLIHSGYEAEQGRFDIWLPEERCDVLATDTTVELIAQHLAQETATFQPGKTVRVRAFEGVQKGAIAEFKV
ncbi:6-pyruvoyl trahydropterin synthase family protein [Salinibius halmophilus]|uniref:6-pyruvoyl trahydropterin synthase family protein n=1 Tax=Salinibius halmophilus TaxID=1853216 RepID=UPI000E66D8D7|nr:6-carboxytetrahydropterin synthase [Salinibius halmophilus]